MDENKDIKRGRCPKNMTEEEKQQRYIISKIKTAERQKEYYDKIYSQEQTCECGKVLTSARMKTHLLTDLHKKRMEKLSQKQETS